MVQHVNLTFDCSEDEPAPKSTVKGKLKAAKPKSNAGSLAGTGPEKNYEKPEGKAKAKAKAKVKSQVKAKAESSKKTPKKVSKRPASNKDPKEEETAADHEGDGEAPLTMKKPAAKTIPEDESKGKRRKAGKSPAGSLSCASRLFSFCHQV